jgi:hypothetical protein
MESTGAAYSPRATKATVQPPAQTSYLMPSVGSRPPRQAQPGMDAQASEQQVQG